MSTYYATFTNWDQAQIAASELINGGVSPDDLSLLLCHVGGKHRVHGRIRELSSSVGDATSIVGRSDDPEVRMDFIEGRDLSELTASKASILSPVDTSRRETDVETVDQMVDSQDAMERLMSPHDGISYGDHEKDDLALTVLTGYPTAPSHHSSEISNPFEQADQGTDSLSILDIPGVGLVIGGGSLATVALDLAQTGSKDCQIVDQLAETGVPEDDAKEYQRYFSNGEALMAINVTPGVLDEIALEDVAERHGAQHGALYDAPRY